MRRFLTLAGALLVVLGSLGATVALATAETNVSNGLTLEGSGLAVRGYDVVAYFTDGQPTVGLAEHSTVHQDATYRFASREHLEAFQSDPDRYVPRYGGYCAYGVSVGKKFDADPKFWRIVDGQLYLNFNQDIQQTWLKNVSQNIEKADRNWSRISSTTPAELK